MTEPKDRTIATIGHDGNYAIIAQIERHDVWDEPGLDTDAFKAKPSRQVPAQPLPERPKAYAPEEPTKHKSR